VTTRFGDLEMPIALRSAVECHQRNIADLVVRLRSAGMTDEEVRQSTDQLFDSYRPELMRAISALRSSAHA